MISSQMCDDDFGKDDNDDEDSDFDRFANCKGTFHGHSYLFSFKDHDDSDHLGNHKNTFDYNY